MQATWSYNKLTDQGLVTDPDGTGQHPSPRNLGSALGRPIPLDCPPKLMRGADGSHALHDINWRAETATQRERNEDAVTDRGR